MQDISFEELAQALKNLRLWVKEEHEDIAFKMTVLNPEGVAKDIFATVIRNQQKK